MVFDGCAERVEGAVADVGVKFLGKLGVQLKALAGKGANRRAITPVLGVFSMMHDDA